jgi:hypothetical protein
LPSSVPPHPVAASSPAMTRAVTGATLRNVKRRPPET